MAGSEDLRIRDDLQSSYAEIYTPEALEALRALAPLNADRRRIMDEARR